MEAIFFLYSFNFEGRGKLLWPDGK